MNFESEQGNSYLDIAEIINLLWQKKIFILSFAISVFVLSAIYTKFFMPNLYTSSTIIKMAKSNDSNNSSMLSKYSGIASITGISLPASGDNSVDYVAEILKSKDLFQRLTEDPLVKKNLFAAKSYDFNNKKILIDKNLYDDDKDIWIRDVTGNQKKEPSYLEVYEAIFGVQYSVNVLKRSNFISISFTHVSPEFSAEFLRLVINKINEIEREKANIESMKALDYLQKKISTTNLEEVKTSLVMVYQGQIERQMLAKTKTDYIVSIIDPPHIPEKKSSPRRLTISIINTVIAGILVCLFIVFKEFYIAYKKEKI